MTALTDALREVAGVTAIQLGSAIRGASRPK
jgi:putative Mg2+ transporter-C (MgtC) family protein